MTNDTHYSPINCAIHDCFELACMRKAVHRVEWVYQGEKLSETLRFLDIEYTKDGEYLIAENEQHEPRKIRLDIITSQLPY